MKGREGERSKTQEKQVMHNTIAHHPLTDDAHHPVHPLTAIATPSQLSPVYSMSFYCVEYPFGQCRPTVLAVLSFSFLYTCSLTEQDTVEKSFI